MQALQGLSGAAEDAERRRFRRPAAGEPRLFREQPEVLRQYQRRFNYMLVDEYQDTNVVQYLWLRLLAQRTAKPLPFRERAWSERQRATQVRFERGRPALTRVPLPERRGRRREANRPITLLRRRRRPVHLRLARRRGRQHPALRARFSRRQDHPAGTQLPLDRPHSRRRLGPDRRTTKAGSARRCAPTTMPGEKVTVARRGDCRGGSARHRRGDRGAAARRPSRSTRSRSWCAPRSRCASSRTASSRSACPTA